MLTNEGIRNYNNGSWPPKIKLIWLTRIVLKKILLLRYWSNILPIVTCICIGWLHLDGIQLLHWNAWLRLFNTESGPELLTDTPTKHCLCPLLDNQSQKETLWNACQPGYWYSFNKLLQNYDKDINHNKSMKYKMVIYNQKKINCYSFF